jgi:plastocyanin
MRNRLIASVTAGAVLMILTAPAARAQGFGDLKGQIVWAGDLPVAEPLKVDKDQDACLKNGPLLSEKYIVDPKTKGLRWVVVYLVNPNNPLLGPAPIRADLKTIPAKDKKVTMDQPTCQFTPHVLALRQGQTLSVKNSAKVPHNTNIIGGAQNPNLNQIIPPGGHLDVANFKASSAAISVVCTIHGWMKGYIRVFNHPYYAVTDAEGNFEIKGIPAGTWNLVAWQEEKGWVTSGEKAGQPVTIKASDTTDVGKIEVKP